MGRIVNNGADGSSEYHPSESSDSLGPIEILAVLGGVVALSHIVNNYLVEKEDMGEGRVLNNYFHRIDDYEDISEKDPYFQRQYRTHNITYPDIMYQGVRKQAHPDNTFIMPPIPPSDASLLELTYAEPSNIIDDAIIYEQGVPDIKEDMRLTGSVPTYAGRTQGGSRGTPFARRTPGGIDSGAGNTIFTTEYAPGLNEKVRRDNPLVASRVPSPVPGTKVTRLKRLAPYEKTHKRRFNTDYDEQGNPLQVASPVYDTMDYLTDLKLTNEDYGEGEAGGRVSDETLSVWEDFIVKGTLRQGYEIIPSED